MNKKDADLFYNGSHCPDPTAYYAIKHLENENNIDDQRFYDLLNTIFYMCKLADFHLENRIELRDNKTGKIWR